MAQLDDFLPDPRLREIDHVDVGATRERAWEVVRHLDLSRSWLVRALYELRTAPRRKPDEQAPRALRLDALTTSGEGFHVLREIPGEELVVGAVGRFWEADMPFADVPADAFATFDRPGFGKLVWSLRFEALDEATTRIFVELRVTATDEISWRLFRLYFGVIGPFSRFLRHYLLHLVERELGATLARPSLAERARSVGEGVVGALGIAFDAVTPFLREARAHWGLDPAEAARTYPGDELIPAPRWGWTHAIEIARPAAEVWPWLAQLGQDKAGFYSYEALENLVGCHIRNADQIHAEWQALRIGDRFRMHPDVPPLTVLAAEPGRYFLVGNVGVPEDVAEVGEALADGPKPTARVTWLFWLEPLGGEDGGPPQRCRFVSRYRILHGDAVRDRLAWGPTLLEPIGFEMDRRMLLGVKERAERARA
jgi:hypothetical protein